MTTADVGGYIRGRVLNRETAEGEASAYTTLKRAETAGISGAHW